MRRLIALLLAALVVGLVVGGCGANPDVTIDEDLEPSPDSPQTDGLATAATPPPGGCIDIPENETATYQLGEGGVVTLSVEDDRLAVASVQPAGGWDFRIGEEEGDEVEVELFTEGTRYTFEAEFEDDGRLEIELCAD